MTVDHDNPTAQSVARAVVSRGYAHVPGATLRSYLGDLPSDVASAWNHLPLDPYLADGGTYRYRRYGRWTAAALEALRLEADTRYCQDEAINSFAGGITRTFAPIPADIAEGRFLRDLLEFDIAVANHITQHHRDWRVDTHMIRIVADAETLGLPSPEGIHRDGLAFAIVHLVARHAVSGGGSAIYTDNSDHLASITLETALDTLWIDDRRMLHFAAPVEWCPEPQSAQTTEVPVGFRDVLLVGFTER